jgi:hypothetical protein
MYQAQHDEHARKLPQKTRDVRLNRQRLKIDDPQHELPT